MSVNVCTDILKILTEIVTDVVIYVLLVAHKIVVKIVPKTEKKLDVLVDVQKEPMTMVNQIVQIVTLLNVKLVSICQMNVFLVLKEDITHHLVNQFHQLLHLLLLKMLPSDLLELLNVPTDVILVKEKETTV